MNLLLHGCGKERRFKIRSRDEYRVYCCAVKNPNWVCKDFVHSELNCETTEDALKLSTARAVRLVSAPDVICACSLERVIQGKCSEFIQKKKSPCFTERFRL